jgi:hypothetical protein
MPPTNPHRLTREQAHAIIDRKEAVILPNGRIVDRKADLPGEAEIALMTGDTSRLDDAKGELREQIAEMQRRLDHLPDRDDMEAIRARLAAQHGAPTEAGPGPGPGPGPAPAHAQAAPGPAAAPPPDPSAPDPLAAQRQALLAGVGPGGAAHAPAPGPAQEADPDAAGPQDKDKGKGKK